MAIVGVIYAGFAAGGIGVATYRDWTARQPIGIVDPIELQQPPIKAVRALSPEQIETLMRRGHQLLAEGDLVTARLQFRRAADAGDADAAKALAMTYDPDLIARLGLVGMSNQ